MYYYNGNRRQTQQGQTKNYVDEGVQDLAMWRPQQRRHKTGTTTVYWRQLIASDTAMDGI